MGNTRTVTVNVVGDATGLNRTLAGVAGTSETTGHRIGAAFRGAFGVIASSSGGAFSPIMEALSGAGPAMDALSDKSASLGEKMVGVGAGAAAAGVGLQAFGSKDQAAALGLAQAIKNTGGNYDDYKDRIDKTVDSMTKFGYTSDTTQNALQALTQATGSPTKALSMMGLAANLAAAKHEDLSEATNQLIQIMAGKGTKTLAAFGIQHVVVANSAKTLTAATDGETKAHQALASAQEKLIGLEEIDHAKKTLTIADQVRLKAAQDKVTAASENLHAAQQKVKTAQEAASRAGTAQATVMAELAKATRGQAADAADTFSGRLRELKAKVEDTVSELGTKFGPALTGIGAGMAITGSLVETGSSVLKHFSKAASDASDATKDAGDASKGLTDAQDGLAATDGLTTVATDAEAASTGLEDAALAGEDVAWWSTALAEAAALLPILAIVAGVALLGVGIYELVTHWKSVWDTIKAVTVDVWHGIDDGFVHPVEAFFEAIPNFVRSHWQLLLAILTGPVGLAVLFVKDHLGQIEGFARDAVNDVRSVWDAITGVVTAPVKTAVTDAETIFDGIVGYFKAFPAKMASIASGMWDWVTSGLKAIVDDVANIWNSSVGSLSFHIPSWVPGIGGDGFSMPKIPLLAAGGIATKPTLAMIGEAGPEAIVPLGAGGGFGGSDQVIEVHNHFYVDGREVTQGVRTRLLQTRPNRGRTGLA